MALPISPGELSERVAGTVNATGPDLPLQLGLAGESFLQEGRSAAIGRSHDAVVSVTVKGDEKEFSLLGLGQMSTIKDVKAKIKEASNLGENVYVKLVHKAVVSDENVMLRALCHGACSKLFFDYNVVLPDMEDIRQAFVDAGAFTEGEKDSIRKADWLRLAEKLQLAAPDGAVLLWTNAFPSDGQTGSLDTLLRSIYEVGPVPGLYLYAAEPKEFHVNINIHCPAGSGVSAGEAIYYLVQAIRAMANHPENKYAGLKKLMETDSSGGAFSGDVQTSLGKWFQFSDEANRNLVLDQDLTSEELREILRKASKVRPRTGNQKIHEFHSIAGQKDQRYYIGVNPRRGVFDGFRSSGCLQKDRIKPEDIPIAAEDRYYLSNRCEFFERLSANPIVQAWLREPAWEATNPKLKGGFKLAWQVQRAFVPYLAEIWTGNAENPEAPSCAGTWNKYLQDSRQQKIANFRSSGSAKDLKEKLVKILDKLPDFAVSDSDADLIPILGTHAEFLVGRQLGDMQWMTISESGGMELNKNLDGYLFSGHTFFDATHFGTFAAGLTDDQVNLVFRNVGEMKECVPDLSLPENEVTRKAIMDYLRQVAEVTDSLAGRDHQYPKVWEKGGGELVDDREFPRNWEEVTACGEKSCVDCLEERLKGIPDESRRDFDTYIGNRLCDKMMLTHNALSGN